MAVVEDLIRRELELPVPPASVFRALVEPDLLAGWYGRPSGPVEAGVELTFTFGEERSRARILEVRPGRSVTYRWVPGTAASWGGLLDPEAPFDELPTTLVELRVESVDDPRASRIRVLEAGFAALPRQVGAAMQARNTGGWGTCCERLEGLVDALVA